MRLTGLKRSIAVIATSALAGCGGGGGYGGSSNNGGGGNVPKYTVGGTVTGLKGSVILRNNGGDDLTVTASGAFTFNTSIANGVTYTVTVQRQPSNPAQNCTVANGSGTISTTNITTPTVTCTDLPAAELQEAVGGVHTATLFWTPPDGAASFNVYASSAPGCDVANFANCPDGARVMNVTSPGIVGGLRNGQVYFFRIETVYTNGSRGLSNELRARPNALAFDGGVRATTIGADGTVYLGGDFTRVGAGTGSAVPVDASSAKATAPDYPLVDGDIFDIVADGSGGWYLAGKFTHVGGVARNRVAHVLADGKVDEHFDPGPDGLVFAVAVHGDIVYIAGQFDNVGPRDDRSQRHCLAAFSATGEVLPWRPAIDCNLLTSLAVGDDGTIYVGGFFGVSHGGVNRNGLAAFTADGALLDSWDVGVGLNGFVEDLLVSGNKVYVAGVFDSITSATGDVPAKNLAAIGTDGVIDQNFRPDPDGEVTELAQRGDTIYVGGGFHHIGSTPDDPGQREQLAAVDAQGRLLDWQPQVNGRISALAVGNDVIYVGGRFTQVGPTERRGLAAFDADGALLPWRLSPAGNVEALAVADGVVYVGGDFAAIDSVPRLHLAAVDAQGDLLPWAPRADFAVRALAFADDTVFAGGDFNNIDDTPRQALAAIGVDGSLKGMNHEINSTVTALTIIGDAVYFGGDFTGVDRLDRRHLAAVKKSGELLDWKPRVTGTQVNALAHIGNTIYVGGRFDHIDNEEVGNLAAIGVDGIVSTTFKPSPNGTLSALATTADHIYLGGEFGLVNNTNTLRQGIAAVDMAGVVDPEFVVTTNPRGRAAVIIRALAIDAGRVYIGGSFSSIGTGFRNNVAAVNTRGEVLEWNPGGRGTDEDVASLSVGNGTVYLGGFFESLGRVPRSFFGAASADGTGDVVE